MTKPDLESRCTAARLTSAQSPRRAPILYAGRPPEKPKGSGTPEEKACRKLKELLSPEAKEDEKKIRNILFPKNLNQSDVFKKNCSLNYGLRGMDCWLYTIEYLYNRAYGIEMLSASYAGGVLAFNWYEKKKPTESRLRSDLRGKLNAKAEPLILELEKVVRSKKELSDVERARSYLNSDQLEFAKRMALKERIEKYGISYSSLAQWLFDAKNWIILNKLDGKKYPPVIPHYYKESGFEKEEYGIKILRARGTPFFETPKKYSTKNWNISGYNNYLDLIAKNLWEHRNYWMWDINTLGYTTGLKIGKNYYGGGHGSHQVEVLSALRRKMLRYTSEWTNLLWLTEKNDILRNEIMTATDLKEKKVPLPGLFDRGEYLKQLPGWKLLDERAGISRDK